MKLEHTVLREHTFGFYPSYTEIESREQSQKNARMLDQLGCNV